MYFYYPFVYQHTFTLLFFVSWSCLMINHLSSFFIHFGIKTESFGVFFCWFRGLCAVLFTPFSMFLAAIIPFMSTILTLIYDQKLLHFCHFNFHQIHKYVFFLLFGSPNEWPFAPFPMRSDKWVGTHLIFSN